MPDTVQKIRSGELILSWINDTLIPWIKENRLTSGSGIRLERGAGGTLITSVIDLSVFAFGWAGVTDEKKAKINGGPIQRDSTIFWCEDAEVVVGGDENSHHIIYADHTGIVLNSVTISSFVGHDELAWRRPLYETYLSNGKPVMHRILWNVIDLKTWFSASSV